MDTLQKLRTDPALATVAEAETDRMTQVDAILQKKAEGRPLTPEEYDQLIQFVDRIERRSATKRQAEKKAEELRRQEVRATLPEQAFRESVAETELSEHISRTLMEAGYITLGDLMLQMKLNPDVVLALQGIGPKAMLEIDNLMVAKTAEFAAIETPPVETVVEVEAPVEQPSVEPAAVEPEAAPVAEAPAGEQPVSVEEAPEPVAEGPAAPEAEEEMPATLDELFALKPEALEATPAAGDEEEDESGKKGKKKGKKKKHVEVTYDPDRDLVMVRKKHKRGDGWGDWE